MGCGDSATPPIACTLTAGELTDRASEWAELLALVSERDATTNGVRLRLPSTPQAAATAADLIVREVQCCAFFTFVLNVDVTGVCLDVTAPPEGRGLLEQLIQ